VKRSSIEVLLHAILVITYKLLNNDNNNIRFKANSCLHFFLIFKLKLK